MAEQAEQRKPLRNRRRVVEWIGYIIGLIAALAILGYFRGWF